MWRWASYGLAALAILSLLMVGWSYLRLRERDRLLDEFIVDATRNVDRTDLDAVAMALSKEAFLRTNHGVTSSELTRSDRLESWLFNMGSGTSLSHKAYGVIGHDQYGPCGTMSRLLLAALWRLGIPARKLHLFEFPTHAGNGHTMVEFFSRGRWQVISPSDSSFVWRNRAGRIATVEEIRSDPQVFRQILAVMPQYPYTFDNPWNIRWEKLPPPLPGLLHAVLGDKRYRTAQTPKLYDLPRLFFFRASLGLVGLWSVLALLAHRRARVMAE